MRWSVEWDEMECGMGWDGVWNGMRWSVEWDEMECGMG